MTEAGLPGLLRTALLLRKRLRPMVVGVTELLTTTAFVITYVALTI